MYWYMQVKLHQACPVLAAPTSGGGSLKVSWHYLLLWERPVLLHVSPAHFNCN